MTVSGCAASLFNRAALVSFALLISHSDAFAKNACSFSYNNIEDTVVRPALLARFGESIKYFDLNNPSIRVHGRQAKLLFVPTKTVDGHFYLYEGIYVIEVDTCTSKVIRAYEEQ